MANGLASFASEGSAPNVDDLVIGEALDRKYTLDTGAVARGDLVGVITATGKVIKSLSAAADGSQTPVGIAAHAADGTAADVDLMVYVKGRFNSARVGYGTAHTYASVYAGLRDQGIYLEVPVLRYPNS